MLRHLLTFSALLIAFCRLPSQSYVAWDSSFSADGWTLIDPALSTLFAGVATLPDGRVICSGAHDGLHRIYSLDSAGNPDIGFGGPDYFTTPGFSGQSDARYLKVDGYGRLVTAGTWKAITTDPEQLLVMRHLADGTPDSTFHATGGRIYDNGLGGRRLPTALALHHNPDSGMVVSYQAAVGGYWIMRLRSNSDVDSSYGTDGAWGTSNFLTSVAMLPDGSVLFGGLNSLLHGCTGRLLPDGTLDPAYAVGGIADVHPSPLSYKSVINALLPLPSGKLLAGGYMHDTITNVNRMMVVRLKEDGSVDSTFGTAGYLMPDFGGDSLRTSALSLAQLPDGRTVAAGMGLEPPFIWGWSAALFDSTGMLDTAAWDSGRMLVKIPTVYEDTPWGMDMAVQPDGRLLVASSAYKGHRVMVVMRLLTTLHILLTQDDFNKAHPSLLVFPNPVRESLSISMPETYQPTAFALFDLEGRLLHAWPLDAEWLRGHQEISLPMPPGLNTGFYLLQACSNQGMAWVRIQVQ